ncbi:MAG TPA: hypothetical protein VMT16_05790 [Thermoanaerobaculia bacterium]|nr:hypothetical protein [Thermoanaerobaculia bacterium]
MAQLHPWLAPALLVSLAVAACAGRGEPAADGESAPPVATAEEAEPTPAPPAVPEALRCAAAGDCALSQLPRPVAAASDCYCPTCPQSANAAVTAAHQASWQAICAGAWEEANRCAAPMCPPLPGRLECGDGRCALAVEQSGG